LSVGAAHLGAAAQRRGDLRVSSRRPRMPRARRAAHLAATARPSAANAARRSASVSAANSIGPPDSPETCRMPSCARAPLVAGAPRRGRRGSAPAT
jgi:hypothetical protein